MAVTLTAPAAYADIEIRVLPREAAGYPVELTFGGRQEFGRGYLRADVLPWLPAVEPAADGARLFDSLFADPRLRVAWAELRGRYPHRRIRLRIDPAAPELHTLPWELLRETRAGGEPALVLAADAATPFSRYLAGEWEPGRVVIARPLRMLVAIANPSNLAEYGLAPVDVVRERQAIEAAIGNVSRRDMVVTFLDDAPVTLARLEAVLQDGYHFVHIVAHGDYRDGQAVLFLADAGNRVARVSDEELAQVVSHLAHPVQMIFLASCQSATRSSEDAFRGLAPRLVQAEAPAVLAMQGRVPVEIARSFAQVFYTRLLRHGLIDLAANEARLALISAGFETGWEIPALYMRVPDGAILTPRRTILEGVRRQPVLAAILLLSVLTVLFLTLGLPTQLAAARQPGGLLAGLIPQPAPTPTPLPEGFFNVAVAQFAPVGATSNVTLTQASQKLSTWLYEGLKGSQNLDPGLSANFRAPAQVGMIAGQTPEERAANAARVAEESNATVVIYGQVSADGGGLTVAPEFYVAPRGFGYGFSYGAEVTGPGRLGEKVRFSLPLRDDAAAHNVLNSDLESRRRALQYIIYGLNYLYRSRYANAAGAFESATQELQAGKGREVALLLRAAAQLRLADQSTSTGDRAQLLDQAAASIQSAQKDAPAYARSYLGLGAIAINRAQLAAELHDRSGFLANLIQATEQYSASLAATDQPPLVHVPIRATFGLAQAEWLGYRNAYVFCGAEGCLPGWSADIGRGLFDQVIQAYNRQPAPDLIWFAGMAYCLKGGLRQGPDRWQLRADDCQKAADLLNKIPADPPTAWIARFWREVGGAKGNAYLLGQPRDPRLQAEGIAAYQSAITLGQSLGPPAALQPGELASWQHELAALQRGEP
jgi:hypothetical protein